MTKIAALLKPRMVTSEVTTSKKEITMKKVAINKCFGGFGISNEAFEKLLDRKGIAFDRVEPKKDWSHVGATYYEAGHAGDDNYYLSDYDMIQDRADPDLIAVIEQLGEKANAWAACIEIVEVPPDVFWHIHEYDGMEHVAEDHRTWG
jgi:hypothetical protein